MQFTTHCATLNNFHARLSAIENPSPLQTLVFYAFGDITKNCNLFDNCITTETPFFKEFFDCINVQDSFKIDEEDCFSLFECLVIFFREKRLRFGIAKLSSAEKDVLEFFENSGHWDHNENTIVGTWYWCDLPQRVMNNSR